MSVYCGQTNITHTIVLPSSIIRVYWSDPVARYRDQVQLGVDARFVRDQAQLRIKVFAENGTRLLDEITTSIRGNSAVVSYDLDWDERNFRELESGKAEVLLTFTADLPEYGLQASSPGLPVALIAPRFSA